jgi:hypothetical protein
MESFYDGVTLPPQNLKLDLASLATSGMPGGAVSLLKGKKPLPRR